MNGRIFRFAAVAVLAACADSATEPDSDPRVAGRRDEGQPVPAVAAYEVTLRYLGAPSARQKVAVERAVQQWQRVITGDLASIPMKVEAGACFKNQPAINETVDDVLIYVDFTYVDGAGGILGEAGPCFVRSDNGLPIVGVLRLDNADLRQMEAIGTIDDVVLHEIGHVLGIGTLWGDKRLLSGQGSSDPQFIGVAAQSAYRGVGGRSAAVPVENTGEEGTREGHWREAVFGNELMTGWIGTSGNPMSAVTIASLQDLGYNANAGLADAYALSGGGGTLAQRSETRTDLRGRERVIKPKFKVDRRGGRHPHR